MSFHLVCTLKDSTGPCASDDTILTKTAALTNTYDFDDGLVTESACGVDLVIILRTDVVIQKVVEEVADYPN